MIQTSGHITYVTVEGRDSDWVVAKFREDTGKEVIVSGNLAGFKPKEPLVLHGDWVEYKGKSGVINQIKVVVAFRKEPVDLKTLELFLANAVPGCGPFKAKQMVKKHGNSLFEYLNQGRTDKLIEVKGIGKPTADRIVQGYREKSLGYHMSAFLCSIGVSPEWTDKVQQALGPDAIRIIRKNPYRLTKVRGIAFKKADDVALKLGWKLDSIERAEATLFFVLDSASEKGHCYLPREELIHLAALEMFKPPEAAADAVAATPAVEATPTLSEEQTKALLNKALDANYARKGGGLVKEVANTTPPIELVYLSRLYNAEVLLARKIRVLLENKPKCRYTREQLAWISQESEKALQLELTDEQRAAVINAFIEPISILTGGPGTGKTAVCRVLVSVAKRLGYILNLCAPTGRAAKHLSNVTEEPALTIHRLLKYDPDEDRWCRDENDQLQTDMVISDEVSMVDVELAFHVADGIKPGTPWLIIGDKDQLPAVSPGKVLEDLINCGKIPTTRLTKIFRQAEKSLIVQNAHRILKGEDLRFPPPKQEGAEMADCYLMEPPTVPSLDEKGRPKKTKDGKPATIEDYSWIKSRITAMCKTRVPQRMKLNPIRDVQVLTPMREKGLGAKVLNETLQDALNPMTDGVQEVVIGNRRFRTGDRVQQHRNNYKLGTNHEGVYNGDIGFITSINTEDEELCVDFGGDQNVKYPFEDAKKDLHLGYAMTVHRSQGGEFPVVIVVLLKANQIMLQRNLLYTAATRAKRLLVFMGLGWVIKSAVKNAKIQKRNSFLAMRMRREMEAQKAVA